MYMYNMSKTDQLFFELSEDLTKFMLSKIKYEDGLHCNIQEIKECMDVYLKGGHGWQGSVTGILPGSSSIGFNLAGIGECFIELYKIKRSCPLSIRKDEYVTYTYVNIGYRVNKIVFTKPLFVILGNSNDPIIYPPEFLVNTIEDYFTYPDLYNGDLVILNDIVNIYEN